MVWSGWSVQELVDPLMAKQVKRLGQSLLLALEQLQWQNTY